MLKNKKILIILALALIIFSITPCCFSATNDSYYNTFPNELFLKIVDLPEWSDSKYGVYGFHWSNNNGYRVFFIDNEDKTATCFVSFNNYSEKFAIKTQHSRRNYIIYDYDSNYNFVSKSDYACSSYQDTKGKDEYILKNINAYEGDKLFFQSTPLLAGVIVPEAIMRLEVIPIQMKIIITTLVPVGLTIFGALLLVYLLGSKKWLLR